MEDLELPAGEWTFRGRAAGPPDGPLVLLLHGFPQSSYEWRHQLVALGEAGYRAVAFDQRGYSPAARPEGVERYGVDHLVSDVVAVADGLGAHQVDVVGHDFGAVVGWSLAARHPQRLRSYTAVSVPHPAAFVAALASPTGDQARRSAYVAFFQQEGTAEAALLAGDGGGLRRMFEGSGFPLTSDDASGEDGAAALAGYVAAMQEPGALTAALNWYRALSPASFGPMAPVAVPTMYVWSDDDPALGREAAEGTAAHVAGPYRFEVLTGVGHWIPESAPEALNRLLLDHLSSIPST